MAVPICQQGHSPFLSINVCPVRQNDRMTFIGDRVVILQPSGGGRFDTAGVTCFFAIAPGRSGLAVDHASQPELYSPGFATLPPRHDCSGCTASSSVTGSVGIGNTVGCGRGGGSSVGFYPAPD